MNRCTSQRPTSVVRLNPCPPGSPARPPSSRPRPPPSVSAQPSSAPPTRPSEIPACASPTKPRCAQPQSVRPHRPQRARLFRPSLSQRRTSRGCSKASPPFVLPAPSFLPTFNAHPPAPHSKSPKLYPQHTPRPPQMNHRQCPLCRPISLPRLNRPHSCPSSSLSDLLPSIRTRSSSLSKPAPRPTAQHSQLSLPDSPIWQSTSLPFVLLPVRFPLHLRPRLRLPCTLPKPTIHVRLTTCLSLPQSTYSSTVRVLRKSFLFHPTLNSRLFPSYAHILAYLRQPLADDSLPYALQLHNYVSSTIQASSPSILQSKLDTLIEVRDEAAYLNLEGLQRLCVDEIRNRYNSKQQLMIQMHGSGQGQHMRGLSSSSMQSLHSLHASIYNLHPLQEKAEAEVEAIVLNSTSTSSIGHPAPSPLPSSLGFNNASSGAPGLSAAAISIRRGSKQALAPSLENIAPTPRTPPTPQSFEGRGAPDQTQNPSQSQANRSRSSSRSRPTAPAGWI